VGTRFQPVLADPIADPSKVQRVVLLSGKIYYDLIKERHARGFDDAVAFVRIEELSPFPYRELEAVLKRYDTGELEEVCYLQEEPRNQGAYGHVVSRVEGDFVCGYRGKVRYLGRRESAVPAPGVGRLYAKQQKEIIDSVFEEL
jgi:probable 2-oxoglutarate dehydrogenase E1 component DHKTD1